MKSKIPETWAFVDRAGETHCWSSEEAARVNSEGQPVFRLVPADPDGAALVKAVTKLMGDDGAEGRYFWQRFDALGRALRRFELGR